MFKMKRRFYSLILTFIIAGILFGLIFGFLASTKKTSLKNFLKLGIKSRVTSQTPGVVADKYLKAWESFEPKNMYALLSKEEKKITPLEQYSKSFEEFPIRPIKHEKISVKRTGQKAVVKMLVTWPSLEADPSEQDETIVLFFEDNNWRINEAESFK
jgi:hypothetical protein